MSSPFPKIKISVDLLGRGTVEINGQKLEGVRAVNVRVRGPGASTNGQRLNAVFLQLIGEVEYESVGSVLTAEMLGVPLTIHKGQK